MYTVKFIDNEEFDSLPYNRVASSIGVADRNSGIAYVRNTGNPMDIFTAYHELEHLKGDDLSEYESPGEDGVYYKDLGSMFQNILPTLGGFFTGGPIGAGIGAAGTLASKSMGGKQQPQQSQPTMDQFNPGPISQPQEAQSPAVSQVGGGNSGNFGGGNMGGSAGTPGGGMIGKVQDYLRNQAGFYSGRTPQGGM